MHIPEELRRVLEAIRKVGRPYLVGGCVRDALLGHPAHDFDVEVFDVDFERLRAVLADYGPTDVVGKSFGVVKVRLNGRAYDFSLPRRERKTGAGHRGFDAEPDPSLTFTDAATRRDFTINAIGYDPFAGAVIDPHRGEHDLKAGWLRHVGPAFVEDPLRVLRGVQLASRFDLRLAPETVELCRSIESAFGELPRERVWAEWEKWARMSVVPSRGLEVLEQTGWIRHFPEIAALKDCPQEPEWHPEGDVLTHTRLCLDALARIPEWHGSARDVKVFLMFAVLTHDFGKATTTQRVEKHGRLRWVSPGHDRVSGELAEEFLAGIGAPKRVIQYVRPLVEQHMYHIQGNGTPKPNTIRRLARRLAPANIEDLAIVMTADIRGRSVRGDRPHPGVRALLEAARQLRLERTAPSPLILGRHLLARGMEPGPQFKPILNELFEAQLEGAFDDEAEAMAYLDRFMKERGDGGKHR